MALCPHCWESLGEPIPAVCPKCGRPQPLHMDIPDVPPDDVGIPNEPAEPSERWSMEALFEAGPAPQADSTESVRPTAPPQPPWAAPPRPVKARGATGLVVLVMGIILVGGLAAIPFDVAPRDEAGRISAVGRTIEAHLTIGDCYGPDLELGEAFGGAVTATPCSEPHLWEVVGRLNYPGDTYPGEAAMEGWAVDLCRSAFRTYVGALPEQTVDLEMWYRFPREGNWDAGSRVTWCLATRGQNSTGSVRAGT